MKNRIKYWLQATQAPAHVITLIPVAFGSSFALYDRIFDGGMFLLSLVAVLLLQAGTALLAGVAEHLRYSTTQHPFLLNPLLEEAYFTVRDFRVMATVLLLLASVCGIVLALETGPLIWWLGLCGIVAMFLYRSKTSGITFQGLTEILMFLIVGPLVAIGSYYVQTGFIRSQVLICALPIGLLASIIESVIHLRDLPYDRKLGNRSLAVWLGRRRLVEWIRIELFAVYVGCLVLVLLQWMPIEAMISWLSIPLARRLFRLLQTERSPRALHLIIGDAILLYVVFGLLYVIGFDIHLLH